MRVTKEQLIKLIGESTYKQLEEAKKSKKPQQPIGFDPEAVGPKGSLFSRKQQARRKKHHGDELGQAQGQIVRQNFSPIYVNEKTGDIDYSKTLLRPEGWVHIGWRLFERIDIFFIGKQGDIRAFLSKYNMEVSKILKQSGLHPKNVRWSPTKLTKSDPRRKPGKTPTYALPGSGQPEDEKLDAPSTAADVPVLDPIEKAAGLSTERIPNEAEENIKRQGFLDILNNVFSSDAMNKKMTQLSLPLIVVRDRDFLNRYAEGNGNTTFEYATHAFNTYESQQQFRKLVFARSKPDANLEELQSVSQALAMQFNNNYKNLPVWSAKKSGASKESDVTPVYQLNRLGDGKDNFEVAVEGILTVMGSWTKKNEYTWTITYVVKYGKKLTQDLTFDRGLKANTDIVETIKVNPTIEVDDDVVPATVADFDDKNTIMNSEIKDALFEVSQKLRNRIMELTPLRMQQFAKIRKPSFPKGAEPSLNEEVIDRIIRKELRKYQ